MAPYTKGSKAGYYHYFSDSNLDFKSVSGGSGYLAGGEIQGISSRQHLAAPDAYAAEVVAAGTNLHHVVPVNGLLQELGIRVGLPTPFYLDNISTLFVSSSDTAVKKSVWLLRRALVIQEGVNLGEILPIHISEKDMVADILTKYLPFAVWRRHMHYRCNLPGDPDNTHDPAEEGFIVHHGRTASQVRHDKGINASRGRGRGSSKGGGRGRG